MSRDTLLYITFKDFDLVHHGSLAKVYSQCRVFEQAGMDVELLGRRGNSTVEILSGKDIGSHQEWSAISGKALSLLRKIKQIGDMEKYVKSRKYDYCYIRYDYSDPLFIRLLNVLSKACGTIVIELPTFPYEDEFPSSLFGKTKLAIDKAFRGGMNKYVSRFVTFYEHGDSFVGVPILVVPNGYDYSQVQIAEVSIGDDVHIAAVSSMRVWHGYERFIEGMDLYYSSGGSRNVYLHLIGDGPEKAKYEALVEQKDLTERVTFEGALSGDELDQALMKCGLGIDSLGRHRSGIAVLSSLKSREYAARGIPFINGCELDIVGFDCPYVLFVPADETPVDISSVVAFYDGLYRGRERTDVAQGMRDLFEPLSDMRVTMEPLVRYLREERLR